MDEMISIPKEVARIIFDLAVSADSACSGYMDTEDVLAMRHLAGLLGVDPAVCTGSEFAAQFPHTFDGIRPLNNFRGTVVEWRADLGSAWNIRTTRPETNEEVLARFGGEVPEICKVHLCEKPADDPIHTEGGK